MSDATLLALLISVISAAGAIMSARAAANASKVNAKDANRVEMEKEAYDRARKYDVDTIKAQELKIEQLRTENQRLIEDNLHLHELVRELKNRIERLETRVTHDEKVIFDERRDPST